jgi:predicted dehydrogenase
MKNKTPSILLIGVGRFGVKHLETLQMLAKKGKLSLVGAVVATTKTQKTVMKKYGIPVWTELTDELLLRVDAVDIVTPPETHFEIAMRCLAFTDVLIEKPLALHANEAKKIADQAKKYGHALMAGHIFRFHPVVKRLESLLEPLKKENVIVKGSFINPLDTDNGRPISLEFLHLFDVIDLIFNVVPSVISTKTFERTNTVDMKYPHGKHAILKLGWEGGEKIRILDFLFSKKEIRCDFIQNIIRITDLETGITNEIHCPAEISPLEEELSVFLDVLKGKKVLYPNAETGVRLVQIAQKAEPIKNRPQKGKRPRVAIIGAGIFGTNCAIELGKFCDVAVFERNEDIMLEASFINQYRHHWGYHYPRSDKTVQDIKNAIGDFENLYNDAIVREFPTYYAVTKSGSKTSVEEYLKFCRKHELPFTIEHPDEKFLNREKTSLCLKTFEPIYNYDALKKIVRSHIKKTPNLKINLSTEVANGKINADGTKSLTIRDANGSTHTETFDCVINATYANYNKFSNWFQFPIKPVRIDLVEALIVKLPLPKISLAVMDGPFTNLVPTSKKNIFTLVHIKESILERYVPKNGIPHTKERKTTMVNETIQKSKEWFPILEKAEVVEVRYVLRAVNANREHDDARPSDVTHQAFGCYSILGGKIVNCVSTAKEIAGEIKKQMP